jgi:TRAP-type C4-dicarboxylate transport system substrate-binding protein
MEVGEAWKKSQTGTPRFNVFTDGSQGGEAEMVRRMRIGQLQDGFSCSVVGLREIEPSIAALQNLPIGFQVLGKSWTTYAKRCAQAWKRNS